MDNRKIGKVTLDLSRYDPKDVYSDGEIEDEMLRIAKESGPEEINTLLNTTKSWPVFYHFSPVREQILRWYPFRKDASALEIGAGCGAVTGALTDGCGQVTALDLSLKRSEINAWRHREADNLKIVVSNFQTFAGRCTEKYDYVTLIGVFEYAAAYIQSGQPYPELLDMANRLLKPEGKLLIAIENRFGAKYFAGCAEDHLGSSFTGIAGYPQESGVRTFNLKEWKALLEENGYADYRVYYPYPDYKLPFAIYSDEQLPGRGSLVRNQNNLDRDRVQLFPEDRFWDSLSGTDYFRDFSNSFFFEISRKEAG